MLTRPRGKGKLWLAAGLDRLLLLAPRSRQTASTFEKWR